MDYKEIKESLKDLYNKNKELFVWFIAMLEHDLHNEQPEYQVGLQYEQAHIEYKNLKKSLKIDNDKGYEFIIKLMDMIVEESERETNENT